jgi:uncharacterized membrane protein
MVFAKSYYIDDSNINIIVYDNGLVNVVENLTYNLTGCYGIIYREIPLINSGILNISGTADSEFIPYNKLENNYLTYEFRFKAEQCNKAVNAIIEYNMSNAVDSYDDVSGFHFMFWGKDFPLTVSLSANIIFPSSIISYWIHNGDKSGSASSSNEINFSQKNVQAENWIEIQAIFERINNNTYSRLIAGKGLDALANAENYYIIMAFAEKYLPIFIMLMPFMLFAYAYFKFGKDEKINYMGSIESNVPYDMPPAAVKEIIGSTSIDSFVATIFDLARRKHLEISGADSEIAIKILGNDEKVSEYENIVMMFFKKYEISGIVEWNALKTKLKALNNSQDFEKRYAAFARAVEKSVSIKKYFDDSGVKFFLKYSLIIIALNFCGMLLLSFFENFSISNIFISILFSPFLYAMLIAFSKKILGKWTKIGRIFELKWKAFKKYLDDYSLLNQHPASSIAVWEKFLVYAIILGSASNVMKVMKLKIEANPKGFSGFCACSALYPSFKSSFSESISKSSSARSNSRGFGGGGGGFGGGHGGGGGGAR